MSLFSKIIEHFNQGKDKGNLQYSNYEICPKCGRFNLLTEFNYKFCSDGNCDYIEVVKGEEDYLQTYDGVI